MNGLTLMFAMVFDRDPLRVQDAPVGVIAWIQNAGGWAALGLVLWLLLGYSRMRPVDRERIPAWQKTLFFLATVVAAVGYLPVLLVWIYALASETLGGQPIDFTSGMQLFLSLCLTAGAAGALFAVALPFLVNLQSLRVRRIWALTKLSFKEAIRRRVLYAFSFFLIVFLFASWFVPYKPEDQVRTYVGVVYLSMTYLLLVAAAILAAFSIPNDIRLQTIHTIITKPVERFEILVGRFLGFTALMSLVLLVMTTLSLAYVLRGIDPAAADESLKARDPLYGELRYENTGGDRATNVGREWDYRSYVSRPMPGQPTPYAVWDFPSVPRYLGDRKQVRCEFTFDIYRTTKGQENRGVSCRFEFITPNFERSKEDEYNRERSRRQRETNRASDAEIDDKLAEEFGYYVVTAKEVTDYHTQSIDVPGGLFRNAAQAPKDPAKASAPQMQVRVSCNSATQYVGMAKYDFYWRLDDPKGEHEKLLFALNFYKGAAGLWFRLCLVIGLAVALSTYLSGVISMLVAGMLYLGGMAMEFIRSIGMGTAPGGGPMEALVRLATRQVGLVPMEETTAVKVATSSDLAFRWFVRRILDVIPDIDRFDLTTYVAEGFNIPLVQLGLDFGMLVLYLIPWMILAYYLIKWREIAAPT
jgi:hypothetical protein